MAHPIGPIDERMMGLPEDLGAFSEFSPETLALALAFIESDPEIAQALTAAALTYVAGDHFAEFCETIELPQETHGYSQMMLSALAMIARDNAFTLRTTMREANVNHV
jgi:hypothetical protein